MDVDNIYLDFFRKTSNAVLIVKNDSVYYANPPLLELFEYTDDEIRALHPSDLSPLRQENGRYSIVESDRMISIAINEGNNIFEWKHKKKDGTIFRTEIILTSIVEDGDIYIFAFIKDISKRKIYQKELKMILDEQNFLISNIADFIYKINKKGDITYVSKSVINLTGYTSENWKKNSNSYLTDAKSNEVIKYNRKKILKNKIKNKKFNIEILNKNGNKLILELVESYYNNNSKEEIIGVAKDITERYQNEMILLKSQKMELISSLSSGLVHEINNSLSIILGNTELLNKKLIKEKELVMENISNIKTATQKANETLNHLLTISNKQTNSFKKIDLNELIMDVFSILRNSFVKSVDLNLRIIEQEAIVNGDLSQLQHMLLNILINSYQAILNKGSFHGSINLEMSKTQKENTNYWKIEITDNGVGIPPNIIPLIFDSFFSTKENSNDLGLGLTSSKNILETHNGFLEVESEENKGTTVKIFIPVDNSIVQEQGETKEEHTENKTILIVDDEPLVLTTAKAILEEFGHTVLASLSGDEGIYLYKKNINDIALVILDMDMPNKSGKDVFYDLKKINNDVKVIISSGYENDERIRDVLKNGAKEFIAKPYGISSFISKINNVLAN